MIVISKIYALTDVGCIRSLNEDNYGYYIGMKFSAYIVADGMGGHNAGEVASKIAVDTIIDYIGKNEETENYEILMESAIKEANSKIYIMSKDNIELSGMGTTITMVIEDDKNVYFGNVGDSRGYVIRDGNVKKITKDHSLVQELLDEGSITNSEAENHPNRNIITRAVGTSDNIEVDIFIVDKKYEYILLCSDGLSNELSEEEMFYIINENTNEELKTICNNLVTQAKFKGGKDNITLFLVAKEEKNDGKMVK